MSGHVTLFSVILSMALSPDIAAVSRLDYYGISEPILKMTGAGWQHLTSQHLSSGLVEFLFETLDSTLLNLFSGHLFPEIILG